MKITCKHNGVILDNYGYDNIHIEDIEELDDNAIYLITKAVEFRSTDNWDFEYGIGGHVSDEYYKIKSIQFANNNTEIIVRVSKKC